MSARWITSVFTAGMSSPLSTMLVDSRISYRPSPNSVITRSSSVGASRPCACAMRASGTISRSRSAMRGRSSMRGTTQNTWPPRNRSRCNASRITTAVERHDEGAHRQPVHRRGGDNAHLAHTGQRKLQGARDRRRGQRQHMHIRLELPSAVPCAQRRNAAPRPPPAGRDRRTRSTSPAAHACR